MMAEEVHDFPEEEVPIEDVVENVIQEVVEDIQKEELESQTVFVSVKEMIQLYEKQVETAYEVPFVEQSVMIETEHNPELGYNDIVEVVVETVEEVNTPVEVPTMKFQNIRRFLTKNGLILRR
jgi:hypothetical protein